MWGGRQNREGNSKHRQLMDKSEPVEGSKANSLKTCFTSPNYKGISDSVEHDKLGLLARWHLSEGEVPLEYCGPSPPEIYNI